MQQVNNKPRERTSRPNECIHHRRRLRDDYLRRRKPQSSLLTRANEQVRIGIVPLSAVAVNVLSPFVRREGIFRRKYGKDNRVLYSPKFLQSFKGAPTMPPWQVAGVSRGSAKIRVTAETPT